MRLVILGAGRFGWQIEDIAAQSGQYAEICFLDDGSTDARVRGKCADFLAFADGDTVFYVAFGDNELREKWNLTLIAAGAPRATLIHRTAYVSPTATVGAGTAILPLACVGSYTAVGDVCIVNSGVSIDHDCTLGAYTHILIGAVLRADNHLPPKTRIEAGQVLPRAAYPEKQ